MFISAVRCKGLGFGIQGLKSVACEVICYTMYALINSKKSTPPQNRRLVVYYCELKWLLDSFVGGLKCVLFSISMVIGAIRGQALGFRVPSL